MPRCCHSMPVRQRGAGIARGSQLQPAAGPKLCREPDGRGPPAAPGGGRAGGARAGGACGTAGPAARVPVPCRDFPRGRLPHARARKNGAAANCGLPQARSCAGSRTAAGRPPPGAAGARALPAPAVPAAPPGLRPECLPLAETSRGGARPLQKPAKKEEPFGSPVNVIRF